MSKEKTKKKGKWWIAIAVLVLIFSIGSCGGDTESQTEATSETVDAETPEAVSEAVESEPVAAVEPETKPEAEKEPTPEPVAKEEEDNLTTGQKNALKQAESYLDYSPFSYTGLIEQLKYEGFTDDEATYGADNCEADWNEQAVKHAQSYLDYSAFSKEGLIEQLEYEGYTKEQAEYAVSQVGF